MLPIFLGELVLGIALAMLAAASKDSWFDRLLLLISVAGGIIGLLFSRSGEGDKGFTEGAKRGIEVGCGCVTLSVVLLVVLFFMIIGLLAI